MRFKIFAPVLALIMAGALSAQPAYAGKPVTPPGQAKKDTPTSSNGNSGNGGGFSTAPTTPTPPVSPLVLGSTLCSLSDLSVGSSACGGFYAGNLNGGGADKNQATAEALNALLGVSTYKAYSFTVLADLSEKDLSGGLVNFAPKLFGQTVVSFHVGGANGAPGGVGYNATAFYLFDAGVNGLDTFTFTRPGLSNARLFQTGEAPPLARFSPLCAAGSCGDSVFSSLTAVPEPGTWALMILGFGAVGAVLRRRRLVTA